MLTFSNDPLIDLHYYFVLLLKNAERSLFCLDLTPTTSSISWSVPFTSGTQALQGKYQKGGKATPRSASSFPAQPQRNVKNAPRTFLLTPCQGKLFQIAEICSFNKDLAAYPATGESFTYAPHSRKVTLTQGQTFCAQVTQTV